MADIDSRRCAVSALKQSRLSSVPTGERSLEVARIYRGLIEEDASRKETDFAFYLEEAALVTLGFCYEKKPAFAGGAYYPILRRLEPFEDEPLKNAVKQHEKRAETVLDLEEKVSDVVKRLKDRGLTSPYLRAFVVARSIRASVAL